MKIFHYTAMLTCLFGSYTLHGAQARAAVQPRHTSITPGVTSAIIRPLVAITLLVPQKQALPPLTNVAKFMCQHMTKNHTNLALNQVRLLDRDL